MELLYVAPKADVGIRYDECWYHLALLNGLISSLQLLCDQIVLMLR
jgi:hypothetical protein